MSLARGGSPRILDSKAKWDEKSPEYQGTKSVLAELPDELRAKLQKVAADAYRALRVRDYGRIDLRLTDTGDVYVIEVNASCYLERGSEFGFAGGLTGGLIGGDVASDGCPVNSATDICLPLSAGFDASAAGGFVGGADACCDCPQAASNAAADTTEHAASLRHVDETNWDF